MIKKEDGQSLVEFALVLPLLLVLLIGIFDFGKVLFTQMHMELIAQEAVRNGALGDSDTEIVVYAENRFNFDSSELSVVVTPDDSTRTHGDYITVTLNYPEEIFDILGGLAIDINLSVSSTMRVE